MLSQRQREKRIDDLVKVTEILIKNLEPIPHDLVYFNYHSDDMESFTIEFVKRDVRNGDRLALIFELDPPFAFYYYTHGQKTESGPADPELIREKVKEMIDFYT